ncbi:MAG: hypothetical protein M1814_000356 [Vezdaea aestivalis]|nr:MAG: hypothetical protein M1814_000356 [Vezdaea aestivalis]
MDEPVKEWNGEYDVLDDPEDRDVLFGALDSFSTYRQQGYRLVHSRRQNLYALPTDHWQLLAAYPVSILDRLSEIEVAIGVNAILARQILRQSLKAFGLPSTDIREIPRALDWRDKATPNDCSKASTIIRQLFRDWSAEGATEREPCYAPIRRAIDNFHSQGSRPKSQVRVLLPGSGLGRLQFDLCQAGYDVEGVEISYHALLVSSFMLNHCERAEQFDLYPWVHTFSNHISRDHQLAKVKVPDVHPATALSNAPSSEPAGSMNVSTGDFCVVHRSESHREVYDVVATAFFIDTAPDFLRYLEAVRNCLKAGGIWVNSGPLLWHFENEQARGPKSGQKYDPDADMGIGESGSVELTDEEVVLLVEMAGFYVSRHEIIDAEAGYIQNPESMQQSKYKLSHWVAKKMR